MAITTSSSVNPAACCARPETGRGWSAVMGRSLGEARLPRDRSQGSSQAPSRFAVWHAAGRVTASRLPRTHAAPRTCEQGAGS